MAQHQEFLTLRISEFSLVRSMCKLLYCFMNFYQLLKLTTALVQLVL